MKILFCGGGTAGHVTPAVAIAESILEMHSDAQILFVGRENGNENRIIEKRGFPLKTIKIHGFSRSLSFENLKNLFTAMEALKKSKAIIKQFAPDAVVGTGGYVTWPVVKSAQVMNIPTVIHESNACPGLVTKLLAPKCDKVLLNLKGAEAEFKNRKNIKTVGNPVRREFLTLSRKAARKKLGISENEFLIVSFGGSGGSEKLNEAVIALMRSHSSKMKNIRHIHGCGNKYEKDLKHSFPELFREKGGCIIKPYIDDMPTLIKAADTVISRCGAMTLAELSAAGIASILIPSPNVTNNHQYKNAKHIADSGAAILIEEKDLSERSLLDAVRKLENDMCKRREMSEKIKSFYVADSERLIAEEILSLI